MPEQTKVNFDHIQSLLASLEFKFARVGDTTVTGCWAFLPNGFQVAYGESACVDPKNYKQADGEKYAKERCVQAATNKLWELEGYLLKVTGSTSDCFVAPALEPVTVADLKPIAHPDMPGFKIYQGKQINRVAYEIQPDDVINDMHGSPDGPTTSEIQIEDQRFTFVHYESVSTGDFICFLDESDIYHVRREVMDQRNYL